MKSMPFERGYCRVRVPVTYLHTPKNVKFKFLGDQRAPVARGSRGQKESLSKIRAPTIPERIHLQIFTTTQAYLQGVQYARTRSPVLRVIFKNPYAQT